MKCIEAQRYISLSLDHELEKDIETELQKHIKDCHECSLFYSKAKHIDDSLKDTFSEKNLPERFEDKIIKNLPVIQKKNQFMRKFKIAGAIAAAIIIAAIIPWNNNSLISVINKKLSHHSANLVAVLMLNNIYYTPSNKVIADDRVIGEKVGTVKKSIIDEHTDDKLENGTATFLPVGTGIYSIKGFDKTEALAVNNKGEYIIYSAIDRNKNTRIPLFSEDYMNAEKIVITFRKEGNTIKDEITDKNSIRAIAEYMKNAQPQSNVSFHHTSHSCTFYFYIKDSNGIGKVVPRYSLNFADSSLDGYISLYEDYKAPADIVKILVSNISPSNYDTKLGGSRQIYDAYLSSKILLYQYIKDDTPPNTEVKIINKGEKIFSNGKLIDDTINGNFKLMITMKNTEIQQKIINKLIATYNEIPGAVSISVTKGENVNTTVIYIGFDKKPDYTLHEYGDTTLILLK